VVEDLDAALLLRPVPGHRLTLVTNLLSPLPTGVCTVWELVDPAGEEDHPPEGAALTRTAAGGEHRDVRLEAVVGTETAVVRLLAALVARLRSAGADSVTCTATLVPGAVDALSRLGLERATVSGEGPEGTSTTAFSTCWQL
jgi:hypothetical protein